MDISNRRAHGTPVSTIAAAITIILAILLYNMAGGSYIDPFYVKVFAVIILITGIVGAIPV